MEEVPEQTNKDPSGALEDTATNGEQGINAQSTTEHYVDSVEVVQGTLNSNISEAGGPTQNIEVVHAMAAEVVEEDTMQESPASPSTPEDRGELPTFFIMIKFGSDDKWVKALVDSGSDRTLVGGDIPISQVVPYLLRLRTAGGEELRVRGKCNGTVWTMGTDGRIVRSNSVFVVVQNANFQVLLGKDWIHSNVRSIDIEDHCLHLRNGQVVSMVQGDISSRVQRSFAISESKPLRGTTPLGFTILPGAQQNHFLVLERDKNDLNGSIPSMVVVLSKYIQSMVECHMSWTRSGELKLTTTNTSGIPIEVEAGTVVAVEQVSEVNRWNGLAFSLYSTLIVSAGKGRIANTILRPSKPFHKGMRLSLQQVHKEGEEGKYLVVHTGSQEKGTQQVIVINQTDQELQLGPEAPLMIHVEEWNKTKPTEEDHEAK